MLSRLLVASSARRGAMMRSFSAVAPSSNHVHKPLPNAKGTIIYTETDEAPALATYSLYPVIQKVRLFGACAGFSSLAATSKAILRDFN